MGKVNNAGGSSFVEVSESSSSSKVQLEDRIVSHLVLAHGEDRPDAVSIGDIWVAVRGMEFTPPIRRGELLDALSNVAMSALISIDRESAVVYPAWGKLDADLADL